MGLLLWPVGACLVFAAIVVVSGRIATGYWMKPWNFWPSEKRRRFVRETTNRVRMGEMSRDEAYRAVEERFGSLYLFTNYLHPIADADWERVCERNGWEYRPLADYR